MGDAFVLIGVVIIVVGFALKFDAILTILIAMFVTGIVGGMSITEILATLGSSFVSNRSMAIFIMVMLVTGTLERNGLQEAAGKFISKFKNASSSFIISLYGVFRLILAAFNVNIGGVVGFVKPTVMPMSEAAIENEHGHLDEEYHEQVKGMASGMENITWFFGQVLFVGGSGALLVQSTMAGLGYEVDLLTMAKIEIPMAIIALSVTIIYYHFRNKALVKKYYKQKGGQ